MKFFYKYFMSLILTLMLTSFAPLRLNAPANSNTREDSVAFISCLPCLKKGVEGEEGGDQSGDGGGIQREKTKKEEFMSSFGFNISRGTVKSSKNKNRKKSSFTMSVYRESVEDDKIAYKSPVPEVSNLPETTLRSDETDRIEIADDISDYRDVREEREVNSLGERIHKTFKELREENAKRDDSDSTNSKNPNSLKFKHHDISPIDLSELEGRVDIKEETYLRLLNSSQRDLSDVLRATSGTPRTTSSTRKSGTPKAPNTPHSQNSASKRSSHSVQSPRSPRKMMLDPLTGNWRTVDIEVETPLTTEQEVEALKELAKLHNSHPTSPQSPHSRKQSRQSNSEDYSRLGAEENVPVRKRSVSASLSGSLHTPNMSFSGAANVELDKPNLIPGAVDVIDSFLDAGLTKKGSSQRDLTSKSPRDVVMRRNSTPKGLARPPRYPSSELRNSYEQDLKKFTHEEE